MHEPKTYKRIESGSTRTVVAVIGIILLLFIAAFMAYSAIDEQARQSSVQSGK